MQGKQDGVDGEGVVSEQGGADLLGGVHLDGDLEELGGDGGELCDGQTILVLHPSEPSQIAASSVDHLGDGGDLIVGPDALGVGDHHALHAFLQGSQPTVLGARVERLQLHAVDHGQLVHGGAVAAHRGVDVVDHRLHTVDVDNAVPIGLNLGDAPIDQSRELYPAWTM